MAEVEIKRFDAADEKRRFEHGALHRRHFGQSLGRRLRAAFPGIPVYLSSEVLPEIREFERTSTTAVCAYVGPILASYLPRLASAVKSQGFPAPCAQLPISWQ